MRLGARSIEFKSSDGSASGLIGSSTWARIVLILIGITVVLRLLTLCYVPLMPEEAYYWMYSQHPSLSYFDHPPMVAWVISAGTLLLNDTQSGVRICSSLIATASIGLMYWYARIWTGRRTAMVSAILLLILPFYLWTGFIATMNSQLIFFWLVCLIGASLALRREWWPGWYLAGVGFGGAMLSKYTGAFVGPGVLLAMILYPPWRKHLRSPHPYLAAVMGMGLFAPVIWWNAHHGWASFRFQFLDRGEIHPLRSWRSLLSPLNFFGLQLVVITPLFAIAVATYVWGTDRRHRLLRQPFAIFAFCTAVPFVALMAWKSVTYDVHLDWTAPAYLALFPLAGRRWMGFLIASRRRGLKAWPSCTVLSLVGCMGFNVLGPLGLLLITPATGHPGAFGPWKQLAMVVQRHEVQLESRTHSQPLIIARGKYRLASELAFYRSALEKPELSSENTTSEWILGDIDGLGFAYWTSRPEWKGRDCIYVTDKDDINGLVLPHFEHVQLVDDPALSKLPGGVVYHLAICEGFKG